MSASLDRLKAAAAQGLAARSTPAAAPAAQPVAAAPAPIPAPTPTPTPAPVAAAPTPAPVAAAVPAVTITPVTTAELAAAITADERQVILNATIEDDEGAANALLALYGKSDTEVEVSTSELFESVDTGGGMAFSLPFASVRKGNWDVHKSCPPAIYDFMPAGKRSFSGIYLGHRVGAIGWPVTKAATGGGAPLFRFAIPHRRMFPSSVEVTRQTLAIGSKIQYKKVTEEKYKHLGKLTPEVHIFCWTPKTGYIVLVCTGFSPSELTAESLSPKVIRDMESYGALKFTIEEHVTVNKKITDPNASNARWTDYFIKADFQPTEEKSLELYAAWEEYKSKSIRIFAEEATRFHKAADYNGLNGAEIVAKLTQYSAAVGS